MALNVDPRWPEPARLTATSAFSRQMSESSASRASASAIDERSRSISLLGMKLSATMRPPGRYSHTNTGTRSRPRPWVLGEDRLVQLDSPARTCRNPQLARRDVGKHADELVAPWDVVDVELEDARVRNRRAPLRRDERREMAVVVVRRTVDLERLGEIGDLLRL